MSYRLSFPTEFSQRILICDGVSFVNSFQAGVLEVLLAIVLYFYQVCVQKGFRRGQDPGVQIRRIGVQRQFSTTLGRFGDVSDRAIDHMLARRSF